MIKRSQFNRGFGRVQGLAHLAAMLAWAVTIIISGIAVYQGTADEFWPFKRSYADSGTLLFAFICLANPIFSFIFCLPIYAVKYLVSGFIDLDDEGVPQSDWRLFQLYSFLKDSGHYMMRIAAWIIVIGILYLIDTERNTISILQWIIIEFRLPSIDYLPMSAVQIVAHAVVVLIAVALRFFLWLLAGIRYDRWLSDFFAEKVLGADRAKVVLDYINRVAEINGSFPAMQRLLSAFRK